MSRSRVWGTVVIAAVAVAGFGLYWFAPWRAFTTTTVADELPAVLTTSVQPSTSSAAGPADQVIARGDFITHAHDTTGTVQIVRRVDGRHQLVIRDLRTSDGPDVRVWLSDQPVPATPPFDIYGQGRHVELGPLKGNVGNLVYDIPADVDITAYSSVDLWCRRFSVSFAAAALQPV